MIFLSEHLLPFRKIAFNSVFLDKTTFLMATNKKTKTTKNKNNSVESFFLYSLVIHGYNYFILKDKVYFI